MTLALAAPLALGASHPAWKVPAIHDQAELMADAQAALVSALVQAIWFLAELVVVKMLVLRAPYGGLPINRLAMRPKRTQYPQPRESQYLSG